MPSTPPDEVSRFEALIGRLDLQPLLTRKTSNNTTGTGGGFSSPFLRAAGTPLVLHLPALFVFGVIQTVADTGWSHDLFTAVCFVGLPVLEALATVVLASAVLRRRRAGILTTGFRTQARYLGVLLTLGSLFGHGASFYVPAAASAAALLLLLAPGGTLPDDGKPWWG